MMMTRLTKTSENPEMWALTIGLTRITEEHNKKWKVFAEVGKNPLRTHEKATIAIAMVVYENMDYIKKQKNENNGE